MAAASNEQAVFDFATAKRSATEIAKLRKELDRRDSELSEAKTGLEGTKQWEEVDRLKKEIARLENEIEEGEYRLVDGLANAGK